MESTQMSISGLVDNENEVCIHDGILLSHRKNEILSFAASWMELEVITLSEISQTQKDKYHMFLLIGGN